MKTSKQLLLYGVAFTLLIGTAFLLQTFAPGPITANVIFDPDTIDLGAPGWTVKTVIVTVWFDSRRTDGRDIDPKTVLIEGVLEPKGGWKHTWIDKIKVGEGPDKGYRWVFRFRVSGSSLRELLWAIITHMGIPGPVVEVPLEVTGFLYNEDAFAGTGIMTVFIPTTPPHLHHLNFPPLF